MADKKFPSLSSFLNMTNNIDKTTLNSAINKGVEQEVSRILNETSVKLSFGNNLSENVEPHDTSTFIKESVKESIEANAARVKSLLEDIFSDYAVSKEREEFWVNKLCKQFNIDKNLPFEERAALIDKMLAEDSDTLNYVSFIVETGEQKNNN
jgi:hypothetical protein